MNQKLEALDLTLEQQQMLAAGGHLEMWDDLESGRKIPMVIKKLPLSGRQNGKKYKWVGYDYQELMELAKLARIALLAVLAELHRLHFQTWGKKVPIEFSSVTLRSLGFSHHEKIRALQALERAGWITVQWHKRKSPTVTIIKGFYLGC